MLLMHLPDELLSLIITHVGPSALRKDVNYLLISQQWYHLVHPVFLCDLDTSQIRLTASTLPRFPHSPRRRGRVNPLLALIQQQAHHLSLRLLGHWWDGNNSRDYDSYNPTEFPSNLDDDNESDNEPAIDFDSLAGREQLITWRNTTNGDIRILARSLKGFTALESLRLEFASEDEQHLGPFWDYIYDSTIQTLLSSLPLHQHLLDLTLDICGSDLLSTSGSASQLHLCPLISQILPQLRKLRLRLPCMCPSLLSLPPASSTTPPNLESLILKLHQPHWQRRGNPSQDSNFCTRPCASSSFCTPARLHVQMYRAARTARARLPGIKLMRISWADRKNTTICGVDVLTGLHVYVGAEFFIYEDDGRPCWWEEGGSDVYNGAPFES